SLYTYSLASYIEIMLSGNLAEKNILSIKEEIEKLSSAYSAMFTKCLNYLEKMSESSIESNVLKGVGEASKAIGGFLGNIPFIKDGPADEFLQDGGEELNKSAKKMEKDIIKSFKKLKNAKTSVFIDRLNELNQIYNHTSDVCIDNENIYFIVS
ncbi:MAG: DNA helicase UvrB, partial [Streptococcus sanguinis]